MQSADGKDVNIDIASPSLQPFTKLQWRFNQQYMINTVSPSNTIECIVVFFLIMFNYDQTKLI